MPVRATDTEFRRDDMRRIWNWAREIIWVNVLAVTLIVLAVAAAALAVAFPAWIVVAMVLALAALTLAVLGLRS